MGPVKREASSPSGDVKITLDEATREFVILRKDGKELAKGKIREQVGCTHMQPVVADGGTMFAVWRTPYNRNVEKNTPLAVYFGDGTHYRTWTLFEIFDEKTLAPAIATSAKMA